MPQITLPDGSSRSFDNPVTVLDVAADIGTGLAKAALAGKVDGEMVDTSFLIQDDVELAMSVHHLIILDSEAREHRLHRNVGGSL